MPNLEKLFSHSPAIILPSNSPFPALDIPGWLFLEQGEIHVFLTAKEQNEYGKRHFIMTLHPGDCFPACPFLHFPDLPGRDYGYLLVPQMQTVCRHISTEKFSTFLKKNPADSSLIYSHLISGLSAVCGKDGRNAMLHSDVMEFPETMRRIIRKTLETISQQERETVENSVAEQSWQRNRLQDQFIRLQNIVGARRQKRRDNGDPLLAALQVIAEKNNLQIHIDPADAQSADPESRLIQFCLVNQWRTRRILLERGFSRLHHSALIGFYGQEALPCILELDGDDSIWYFPAEGDSHPLTPEKESELREYAYCFYESFPRQPLEWSDVVRFLFQGSRKLFLCILAIGVLVGLFGLITPVATAYVTGKIIPTANTMELWQLLILLLSLTMGMAVLNIVPQLCLLLFGSSVLERFLAALFDRIFRLPVSFFHKYSAGDLCTRLLAAIRLQESTFQVLSQQFISSLFSFCSIIMLFYYSWKLTLVAIPLVLAYALLLFCLFMRLQKPLRAVADRIGWESGFLKQVFDGIAKIRGAGAEERIENRFLDEFVTEKKARNQYLRGIGIMAVIGIVTPATVNLIFFYLIGKTWRGSLEVSGFLAFLSAYGSFQAGVIAIGEGLWQLASQKPELERLEVFLKSDVEASEGKPQAEKLDGAVELSHVTFSYTPNSPPVLQDISFSVRPGEFVAIVGPSGAGKSSLVRLLLGFESPENGSILYSGQDLRELDINSVRRQLGVILQNSRIMPGSILENITTGTNCSLAEAEDAVRMAALDKDIASMPMGIHTNVGDGLISGGQQQRILIARALIGKPAIVIMDESTSALDNETQETVRCNIEKLNVTRIIIAHRLSTIINADRIYVLEKGIIRESGTFKELMNHDGVFRELARRQML